MLGLFTVDMNLFTLIKIICNDSAVSATNKSVIPVEAKQIC